MGKHKLKKIIWLIIIIAIGTYLVYSLSLLPIFNVFGTATTHTKGNADKVRVANDGGITGGAITLAIWVNQQAVPALNASHGWISQGDGDANDAYYGIRYLDESGTKKVKFSRKVRGVIDCDQGGARTVTNGEWHHWALTYTIPTLKGYLDGVEVESVDVTTIAATCDDMGSHATAQDHMSVGCIDCDTDNSVYGTAFFTNAVIYDRALTAAEIQRLAFSRPPNDDSGLRLHWPLDEGASTTAKNHSATGGATYDGVITGTTGGFTLEHPPFGYK